MTYLFFFLGPSVVRFLGSSVVRFLFVDELFSVCFLELFVFPSHIALRWIFTFLVMPFLVLFHVPLAVRLATRLLLPAFFGRSVSLFPAYFFQNPLFTNWNYKNFLRLAKL